MPEQDFVMIARAMRDKGIELPDAPEPPNRRCEFCGLEREPMAMIDPWNPRKGRRWVGWAPCTCPEALMVLSEELDRRQRATSKIDELGKKQILSRRLIDAGVGKKWIDIALKMPAAYIMPPRPYIEGILKGNTNNAIIVGEGRLGTAAYILKELMGKGKTGMWVHDGQLATVSFKDNASENLSEAMINADYLVIQDLGTSVMGQYATGRLYYALQMRDSDAKPTITTVAGKYPPSRPHKSNAEAIATRIFGAMEASSKGGEAAQAIVRYIMSADYEPIYTQEIEEGYDGTVEA